MTIVKKPKWTRKPESRVEDLIHAALEVFAEKGYQNSRLEEVAQAAGVTKGAIYYYFKDKEELLVHAVTDSLNSLDEAEDKLLEPGLSASEKIRLSIVEGWKRWTRPGFAKLYRLFVGEIAYSHPLIYEKWLQSGPMRTSKKWAEIIKEGQERGEFNRRLDAVAVSRFMLSSLTSQAVIQPFISRKDSEYCSKETLLHTAVALFMSALSEPSAGKA
jgi:AcrR family transcriptional regulator